MPLSLTHRLGQIVNEDGRRSVRCTWGRCSTTRRRLAAPPPRKENGRLDFDFPRQLRPPSSRRLLGFSFGGEVTAGVSDGDTPKIEQPIRMVSIDTPEKSGYAGKPPTAQPKLDRCRQRLESVESDRIYAAWLLLATTGMRRG